MNDPISRQAAIDALSDGALVNYQATGHNNGLVKAIDVIKGLPSAQSVIRCKDCKWHGYNECFHGLGLIATLDNNFCSYAERRNDKCL